MVSDRPCGGDGSVVSSNGIGDSWGVEVMMIGTVVSIGPSD